jgi:hypothetical protein
MTYLRIDDDQRSQRKTDMKDTEESRKENSFFESIPENIRLQPRGLLPSGALSAHPTILSNKSMI